MKYYTKKWYLNGCVDKPVIDDKEYFELDTCIHDAKIINSIKKDGYYTILIDDKDIWSDYSKIVFHDYDIITHTNLNGAHCLADEIYVREDCIEYHLLIWSENIEDYNNLGYFTIKAKKILFYSSQRNQIKDSLLKGNFLEIKGEETE